MSTSDYITLAGAVGSLAAAVFAAVALWKIRDERRRTARTALLVELLDALGTVPGGDITFSRKAAALLNALPPEWVPTLRVHLGIGASKAMKQEHADRLAREKIDRFDRSAWVERTTYAEIANLLDELA